MFGAAAFFVLFATLIAGGVVGLSFTITSTILLVKTQQKGAVTAWLIGGIPILIGMITFINIAYGSSLGGAPNAADFKDMFKAFALAGLTPGAMLTTGGISQLTWFFISKNKRKNSTSNI